MDEIEALVNQATEALNAGNLKDAYHSCLEAMDVALRELNTVKFVHHSITYKPSACSAIFKLSYNCLQYAEEIVNKQKTPSDTMTRGNNSSSSITAPTPVRPRALTPVQFTLHPTPSRSSTGTSSYTDAGGDDDRDSVQSERSAGTKSPPPIPPKPSRIQQPPKPPLPPKPSRTAQAGGGGGGGPVAALRRERTSSVSFADVEEEAGEGIIDDGDDDPDDSNDARLVQLGAMNRRASPNITAPIVPPRRPLTVPNSLSTPPSPTSYEAQIVNPNPALSRSTSTPPPQNFAFLTPKSFITVIPEGSIDPNNLVAAQTSTGDSLAPPSSPSVTNDHIPLIPIPPLLTTHRTLQTKLDLVETKLGEYRSLKRARELPGEGDGRPASSASITNESIDEAITKYSVTVADTKATLNRVRTLYMRAATVPSILQFPPHLIAYQLTLVESAIFLEIKARALLEHTPRHPNSQIVASTDFFNYLTRLIEHSILLPQEATTRAQHIHHWVKVAAKCHELQNYQTLKAIVSALGTPPVQRLKRTWACMPKKSMTRLEFLSELMSETRNYGRYREHMGMVNSSNVNGMSISVMKRETLKKPTVPFLGTFIHDITYLVAAVKSTSIHSVTSITSATTAVNRDSLNHSERPPSPTLSTVSTLTPENDPRVKDLLATMHYYQSGPKYALVPPSNYTKAAQKHHFRTPSLPSALHRSSGGKGRSSFGGGDEEEEGIETQQQLITHYLLTRAWVSEKIVDELSVLREPPKRPATSGTGSPNRGSGGGGSGAAGSGGSGSGQYTSSIMSTASSAYRASTGSLSFGTNSGSGGDSRPNSMEDGVDVPARTSALVGEDGGTGMVFVSTLDKAEREREGGKEKRGFLSLFSVRTSLEKERPALAEVPQGRRSMAKEEPVLADMVLPDSDDEDEIDSEEYVELDQRSKERRQSWKGTKFMADEEKGIKVMTDEGRPPPIPSQFRQVNGPSPTPTPTTSTSLPKPPPVPAERQRAVTLTSTTMSAPTIKPFSYMATTAANSSNSSNSSGNNSKVTTAQTASSQTVLPVRHSFDVEYIRPNPPTTALPPPPPPLMPKPKSALLRRDTPEYAGTTGGGEGGVAMPGGEEMRILLAKRMANELASRQS